MNSSKKSNNSTSRSSNSCPNTAGSVGSSPVFVFSIPKYILGEFIMNLLSSLLSVSKWKFPLVENPIALSEYNNIASFLALNTYLSELIIT